MRCAAVCRSAPGVHWVRTSWASWARPSWAVIVTVAVHILVPRRDPTTEQPPRLAVGLSEDVNLAADGPVDEPPRRIERRVLTGRVGDRHHRLTGRDEAVVVDVAGVDGAGDEVAHGVGEAAIDERGVPHVHVTDGVVDDRRVGVVPRVGGLQEALEGDVKALRDGRARVCASVGAGRGRPGRRDASSPVALIQATATARRRTGVGQQVTAVAARHVLRHVHRRGAPRPWWPARRVRRRCCTRRGLCAWRRRSGAPTR